LFFLDWYISSNRLSFNENITPDFLSKTVIITMNESEEGTILPWEGWSFESEANAHFLSNNNFFYYREWLGF
jgi:hypothetical protein